MSKSKWNYWCQVSVILNAFLLMIIVALMAGCASVSAGAKDPLFKAGVQYATVKAVKAAGNPAHTADLALEAIDSVDGALDKTVSLQQIDAWVRDYIARHAKSPEDGILFDALRQKIYDDLSGGIPDPLAALSDRDKVVIRAILSDIKFGIKIAGY